MKFRPCIDIHNGKVKQIIGGVFWIREIRQKKILFLRMTRAFMVNYIKRINYPEAM